MRSNSARRRWIAGLFALATLALPTLAAAQAHGHARLELVEAVASQHVTLRYTIENTGDADLAVLKWETPLAGFFGDILDVRVDGKPTPYLGRLAKLGTPGPDNYIVLAPGDSAVVEFDLGEQYLLDRAGQYSVAWRGEAGLDDAKRLFDAVPAAATLRFAFDGLGPQATERYLRGFDKVLQGDIHGEIAYQGCSSDEQSQALSGFNQGKSYASSASSTVAALTVTTAGSSARYKTWFGTPTSSRLSTVQLHYSKIAAGFNGGGYTFVCDCDEPGVFAYVFPSQPYEVHLCPEFWNAPVKGTDSKGGTLVHESSHFLKNGGTQDFAYGQSAAKNLATTQPDKAVMNADNHEYYAENNPAQCKGSTCGGGGGGGGGGSNGQVNWTVKDGCNDGRGFRIKFQDSKGHLYPSANTYYILHSNQAGVAKFSAPRGSNVCLGASTDPPNNFYWCKGINFNHPATSAACCKKVPNSGSLNYTLTLTCKAGKEEGDLELAP